MTTKNDGFSAFPLPMGDEQTNEHSAGMSLRDYFAANATDGDVLDVRYKYYESNGDKPDFVALTQAQARYMHADAMLEARKTQP